MKCSPNNSSIKIYIQFAPLLNNIIVHFKKSIYIIVLTLCFVLAFIGKSYGQGWERLKNAICQQNISSYSEIEHNGLFVMNDGGCIMPFYEGFWGTSRYSYLDRFDNNGNLIWDYIPFYTIDLIDSSAYYGYVNCALQLPNNNIILLHSYSAFSIIDNNGRVIKRVYNKYLEDTININNYPTVQQNASLFYNENNNTIECIGLISIGNSIFFNKDAYDINLQKISHERNILVGNTGGATSAFIHSQIIKDVNGNYIFKAGNTIYRCNNNGGLIFSINVTPNFFENFLDTTIITNAIGTSDYIISPEGMPLFNLTNNDIGEVSICSNIHATVNPNISSNIRDLISLIIINFDLSGNVINTKTIIRRIIYKTDLQSDVYSGYPTAWSINSSNMIIFSLGDMPYSYSNTAYLKTTNVIMYNKNNNSVLSNKEVINLPVNSCYLADNTHYFPTKVATKDNKFLYVTKYFKDSLNISGASVLGIAKIDTLGNADAIFKLFGNVFYDVNNNCIKNTTEKGVPNYTVTATKNNFNNFGTTDRYGNYVIGLADSGNYTVAVRPNQNYPLWNAVCNPTQNITVENTIGFDTVNFALKPSIVCPYNTVNVSSQPPFRIGQAQTYYVSYCNNGTAVSPNTYIIIKLDSLLDINNATIPYTALANHTFRFNIGNLDLLTCGDFNFVATPRIGVVQLNQTLCTEAHIYPDTICTTPNYVGAFIEANAHCLGDSVQFNLQNTGRGNMTAPKKYIVIEGNVMRINQNYQLNINETLTETLAADAGKTYRIIAEQPDNLPTDYGDRFATAAVENCQPITNFSTGFFTQFPNYDGEPYRAVSCNVITGAYDPNDKVASPVGYATPHYIEANTQIDYQINFQNTGNDTAFKVVVVDTISPTLDINTIQLGVASHPYQFQRTDSNVVQFVFDSIFLVDSFRNEPKSHGFVKFKIQQKPNNPVGTKIYNKADIYFDYNAPITTNQTYHTIGRNYISVDLITSTISTKYNVKTVKVFPNPFREKTQIIVDSDELKNPILILMNMEGKVIKIITSTLYNRFDIYKEDLSNGMYLFKVIQGNEEIANGKVIVQ